MSVKNMDPRAAQAWTKQLARLSLREREVVAAVLAGLGMGAEMAEYAYTGEDLLELARMAKGITE